MLSLYFNNVTCLLSWMDWIIMCVVLFEWGRMLAVEYAAFEIFELHDMEKGCWLSRYFFDYELEDNQKLMNKGNWFKDSTNLLACVNCNKCLKKQPGGRAQFFYHNNLKAIKEEWMEDFRGSDRCLFHFDHPNIFAFRGFLWCLY